MTKLSYSPPTITRWRWTTEWFLLQMITWVEAIRRYHLTVSMAGKNLVKYSMIKSVFREKKKRFLNRFTYEWEISANLVWLDSPEIWPMLWFSFNWAANRSRSCWVCEMETTQNFWFYLALCLPVFLSAQYITLDIPMDNSLDAAHQSYITKKYYFVTYFKVTLCFSVQFQCA